MADVIRDSGLSYSYTYQIFNGQKMPSRDKLIAIGFGLHLDLDSFQRMLKLGGCIELYTRVWRDAVIKFCILHRYDIWKTDETLHSLQLDTFLPKS